MLASNRILIFHVGDCKAKQQLAKPNHISLWKSKVIDRIVLNEAVKKIRNWCRKFEQCWELNYLFDLNQKCCPNFTNSLFLLPCLLIKDTGWCYSYKLIYITFKWKQLLIKNNEIIEKVELTYMKQHNINFDLIITGTNFYNEKQTWISELDYSVVNVNLLYMSDKTWPNSNSILSEVVSLYSHI